MDRVDEPYVDVAIFGRTQKVLYGGVEWSNPPQMFMML